MFGLSGHVGTSPSLSLCLFSSIVTDEAWRSEVTDFVSLSIVFRTVDGLGVEVEVYSRRLLQAAAG